jgi:hypothetical protein|tara:strand:- start:8881 stop:9522 length:642 start_codon:yes stop_codon:yes gene_type:complete
MVSKKIIIISFFLHIVFPQGINSIKDSKEPVLSPIIKSLLLPGWGEYALGYNKRAKVMALSESFIFISILGSYSNANRIEINYKAYAAQHAGVNTIDKNRQYWVDIGNYLSIDQFNEEHLRWRDFNAIYDQNNNWNWSWDDDDNRKYFEKMRIKSDTWKLRASFLVGGMVLNHIISAIDALYLFRLSNIDNIDVLPTYYQKTDQYNISLSISF